MLAGVPNTSPSQPSTSGTVAASAGKYRTWTPTMPSARVPASTDSCSSLVSGDTTCATTNRTLIGSAGDVLAAEPQERQHGKQHRVGHRGEPTTDHVVPADRIDHGSGPREGVMGRQPVAQIPESGDLVEDLGKDR